MGKTNPKRAVFTRFVEIGRIVYITFGPYVGKIAVIIDVIDANRIFIEGPTTGVPRQAINLKWIALTKFRIKKMRRCLRYKYLKAVVEKSGVVEKWNQTSWGKRREQKKLRANMNDFDRFKLTLAMRKRRRILSESIRKVKKAEREKRKASKPKKQAEKKAPEAAKAK